MEKLGVCRQMTVLLGLETTMHTIASMTMMRRCSSQFRLSHPLLSY